MLSVNLSQTILHLQGPAGQRWLTSLPAHLARIAEKHALTLSDPFPNLTYNLVLPATAADGRPLVLKLNVPNAELTSEIAALRHYDGRGAARLLHGDPDEGYLLLERLDPGTTLLKAPMDDEAATRLAATLMQQLLRPAPDDPALHPLARWTGGLARLRATFGGTTGPFPANLVDRAQRLFAELLATPGPPLLLHGDLHHDNILAATRQPWLAIDPKGLAGDAEYEVCAWLLNPQPWHGRQTNLPALLSRRLAIFAEMLPCDPHRLRAWAAAHAVLSAWWTYEDHGRVAHDTLTIAHKLAALTV